MIGFIARKDDENCKKCCFEYWEHECLKCNNNECNTGRKGYFVEFDKVVIVEEVE